MKLGLEQRLEQRLDQKRRQTALFNETTKD